MITWKADISGLKALMKKLTPGTQLSPLFKLWAARYSSFIRDKFDANSKGGGDWPGLAESTKAARRKGRDQGNFAVLRNTGMLFQAISVGAKGNLTKIKSDGVIFGFDDTPHGSSGKSIREIAMMHDKGVPGRLPKRQILREPDDACSSSMLSDLKTFLSRL